MEVQELVLRGLVIRPVPIPHRGLPLAFKACRSQRPCQEDVEEGLGRGKMIANGPLAQRRSKGLIIPGLQVRVLHGPPTPQ